MAKVNLSLLILANPYVVKHKIPMGCRGLGEITNVYAWNNGPELVFEYDIVGKQIYDSFHTHPLYVDSYVKDKKYIVIFRMNDSWKNKLYRLYYGEYDWTLNYPLEMNYGRILLERLKSWKIKKHGKVFEYAGYEVLFPLWLQHYYDLSDNDVCNHMDYFEKNKVEFKINFEFKKECYEYTEEKEKQFIEFIQTNKSISEVDKSVS